MVAIEQETLTVFRLASTRIGVPNLSLNDSPFSKVSMPLARHASVAAALTMYSDTKTGTWLLDSAYRLSMSDLPSGLSENKVTVFKINYLKGQPDGPTHGGLYHVGAVAAQAIKHGGCDLELLLETYDTPAVTRRHPIPVRVLRSKHWETETQSAKLVNKLTQLYREWDLDIDVHVSELGIKDSHTALLNSFPHSTPVLVVDSDFQPNGSPGLMYEPLGDEDKYVHLWHVKNPINGLEYGHGSPKLMSSTSMDFSIVGEDMTMSCARGLTVHSSLVGTHAFNTSADATYRTAFREVYKLARATDLESRYRLGEWLTVANHAKAPPHYLKVVAHAAKVAKTRPFPVNDYARLTQEIPYAFNQDF